MDEGLVVQAVAEAARDHDETVRSAATKSGGQSGLHVSSPGKTSVGSKPGSPTVRYLLSAAEELAVEGLVVFARKHHLDITRQKLKDDVRTPGNDGIRCPGSRKLDWVGVDG